MDQRPWVAIQRNPRSGSGKRRRALLELVRGLRSHGLRPRVFSDRGQLAKALSDDERRSRLRCLVAAGGDGTVADLINRYPHLPLAVLPLGTENLLARHVGVSRCGQQLADLIAAGRTRRFDVCQFGTRRFLIMASVGFDAGVIHRLEARRAGNISHWSYLPAIWGTIRRYEFPELQVFVDDEPTPLRGSLAVVSNLPAYALRLPIASSALSDDGLVDVRVFERPSVSSLMRYCYHVVRGQHERLDDVQVRRAHRVRIESLTPAPVQLDGDGAGMTPGDIVVLPNELELFVP